MDYENRNHYLSFIVDGYRDTINVNWGWHTLKRGESNYDK